MKSFATCSISFGVGPERKFGRDVDRYVVAVNAFVKDTNDPNRALAFHTMGCLRAEKIIDYLCDPLQKCLRDENRKTAALCGETLAKLYDLKPELVIDNGFLAQLQNMISK